MKYKQIKANWYIAEGEYLNQLCHCHEERPMLRSAEIVINRSGKYICFGCHEEVPDDVIDVALITGAKIHPDYQRRD